MGNAYLFFAPPAAGEIQPVLAVSLALLQRDPECSVYIASGTSFEKRYDAFVAQLVASQRDDCARRLLRIDLGSSDDVEDYSRHMLAPDPRKKPYFFGTHRHPRGNPIPFFNYWAAFAAGSRWHRLDTIESVLRVIDKIRPDMIIVDQIYSSAFDAVRYSKLPFIVLAPGHPSFAADVNALCEPMSMSGIRWKNSLGNIGSNIRHLGKLVLWTLISPWAQTTLILRRWTLGFRWLSVGDDCNITPPPGVVPEVCAAIMCNVEHLNFYQRWHPKCHFVGPCFLPQPEAVDRKEPAASDMNQWLDDAQQQGDAVIFISFGSMFPFNAHDYGAMIQGLSSAHSAFPKMRVLWKIVKCPGVQSILLPFIRETDWIEDIQAVYRHPSTTTVIHHGGGNTVNETIFHGLKHLVIPQWSDTYDWGATIASYGLGEEVENPGPDLDAEEISQKLLRLLHNPEQYEKQVAYWKRRSTDSCGSLGAAAVIEEAASSQAAAYTYSPEISGRIKRTFH